MAVIELQSLCKRFGSFTALDNINLEVAQGEFVTLLGASGCGKTTTIRIIAGYTAPTSGRVVIDGRDVTSLPPQRRNVGMVFQNYALFPHMTVFDNIAFSLRIRRRPRREIRERVEHLLDVTMLRGSENLRPRQLSGGMQQRVALARALAFEPRILLMDEPLSALDVKLRRSMQVELKRLQREFGVTTIYVTHDQAEALSMSDRVVVMNRGRIVQVGTPTEIYSAPASVFVADFIGYTNLFKGWLLDSSAQASSVKVREAVLQAAPTNLPAGQPVCVSVRPEAVCLRPWDPSVVPTANQFRGTVTSFQYMGSWELATIDVPELGKEVLMQAQSGVWSEGEQVVVEFSASMAIVLPADT